jgi:Protein of unknown function (DUF1207)
VALLSIVATLRAGWLVPAGVAFSLAACRGGTAEELLAGSDFDGDAASYFPTAYPEAAAPIQRLPSTTAVVDADLYLDLSAPVSANPYANAWQWRLFPASILYHPYMANVHESRLSGIVFDDDQDASFFDVSLGGRVGILRFGSGDGLHPEGWQLDMEGAGFPRLALDHNWDVEATDFRFGLPISYGIDNWQYKFSYYHLSSHLGDEYAIRNPGSLAQRINYSRDALVLGASWYPRPAWRLYAEADWAFHFDDGNRPWEFLFGVDYAQPGLTGIYGTPFIAVGGHIREAVDFGGNLVAQTGWLWRGHMGETLRMGFHYYNGKSSQFEFFDDFEEQIGFAVWYDQ